MLLILGILIFIFISITFLFLCKKANKSMCRYKTVFCRDARSSLGMFAYRSELEEKRNKLQKSKF